MDKMRSLPPRATASNLVAIEGLEGAGKSTQVRCVAELLSSQGLAATWLGEFTASLIGDFIRGLQQTDPFLAGHSATRSAWTVLHAVAADTALALEAADSLPLTTFDVVIKDRYRESLVAYQHVQFVDEYGMEREDALALVARTASSLPDPARLLIWLEVPHEERYRRLRRDRGWDEALSEESKRRAAGYDWMRNGTQWDWRAVPVDGTGSRKCVTERIVASIQESGLA